MSFDQLLRAAVDRPLTVDEADDAFAVVMEGQASPVQVAALLTAIRARGVASDEIAGGVRVLRRAMVPVPTPWADSVVDTCGTGGGSFTTFNISTAAGLLASGLGVRVAKHGNRSFTSRCGSADVLEALGVAFDLSPARQAELIDETGIVFMFAPHHHPAMRHVGPVRRELGFFTIMNLLGPLTNPAGARRQVVGVVDPALLSLIADALVTLEHIHTLVVHGLPGLDELSPIGPTRILEVRNGSIRSLEFDPARELGWKELDPSGLAGGDPAENAATITGVLRGEIGGAAKAAVVLNAAAALYVADVVGDLREGVDLATRGIDEGAGWTQLERLREASSL
ncbi:MAG: anthranilate phosphoribosyltransferase [Gemmatimonadota bacterium]|jgi:anthranilate phosphoribosyltransferase|nr:anthranilate phosphoribosyltransferase [Gemmatimonadota bacterium]